VTMQPAWSTIYNGWGACSKWKHTCHGNATEQTICARIQGLCRLPQCPPSTSHGHGTWVFTGNIGGSSLTCNNNHMPQLVNLTASWSAYTRWWRAPRYLQKHTGLLVLAVVLQTGDIDQYNLASTCPSPMP
jgi:hypothetical protein